jgi:hypothetical protein
MHKQGRILIEELDDYTEILQDIKNDSINIKIDELRPNIFSRIRSRLSYDEAYSLIKDTDDSLKCYFRDKIAFDESHYSISYMGRKDHISYFIFYDISVEKMMLIKDKYKLKEEWFN